MKITIDNIEYALPTSMMDVTLQERIDYDKQYGKDLREKLTSIKEIRDSDERDLEFTEYRADVACKALAFFGRIDLATVRNTLIEHVLAIYHNVLKPITEEVDLLDPDFPLQHEFSWHDKMWVIQASELKNDSAMAFGEFLDAKQIVQDLYEVGEQKWTALLALCCIFFRQKDEDYSEKLSAVDEPRYLLLKTLPLGFAIHVGFFLNDCQLSSQMDSLFSGLPKLRVAARYGNILTSGVG